MTEEAFVGVCLEDVTSLDLFLFIKKGDVVFVRKHIEPSHVIISRDKSFRASIIVDRSIVRIEHEEKAKPEAKKIFSLKRAGGKVTKEALLELAQDPDLENFMVVSFWKDGTCSTGWSAGVTNGELAYGSMMIHKKVIGIIE